MCNIHFDEQAVRAALACRAEKERTALYWVNPTQIHRDLYDGQPVGGLKLHFIQRVKAAMVDEVIREAFLARARKEQRDLHQVGVWCVAEDVLGTLPQDGLTQVEYLEAREVVQAVWYDMIIEESRALQV